MIASLDVLAGEFIHTSFYLFAGHKPEVIILEEAVLTLGDIRLTRQRLSWFQLVTDRASRILFTETLLRDQGPEVIVVNLSEKQAAKEKIKKTYRSLFKELPGCELPSVRSVGLDSTSRYPPKGRLQLALHQ